MRIEHRIDSILVEIDHVWKMEDGFVASIFSQREECNEKKYDEYRGCNRVSYFGGHVDGLRLHSHFRWIVATPLPSVGISIISKGWSAFPVDCECHPRSAGLSGLKRRPRACCCRLYLLLTAIIDFVIPIQRSRMISASGNNVLMSPTVRRCQSGLASLGHQALRKRIAAI